MLDKSFGERVKEFQELLRVLSITCIKTSAVYFLRANGVNTMHSWRPSKRKGEG
jgi:hypothetical protein